MTPDIKGRIPIDGDIVARSHEEAKRRIEDRLFHEYPNYALEEPPAVWLKDGPQLHTERTRWWEYTATLILKRRKTKE